MADSPRQSISPAVPLSASEMVPPREERMDVTKLGKWLHGAVEASLRGRRDVELDWLKIKLILSGYHYFNVDPVTGLVLPDVVGGEEDIRAYTNLMLNRYRRELGRRNSVSLSIAAAARNFTAPDAVKKAKRARMAISAWQEEEAFEETFDEFNQMVLRMSLAAFLVEPSWDQQTAKVWAIPGADLFPIPAPSTAKSNAEGVSVRRFLSEAWLEASIEAKQLAPEVRSQVAKHAMRNQAGSAFVGHNTVGMTGAAEVRGVEGYFFYLRPSREYPEGLHGLEINEKIYAIHINPQTGRPGLPVGGPPIVVWDTKFDFDWYGQSFCAPLIGLQLEDDRQLSNEIGIAEVNRHGGWTMVPDNSISINDLEQRLGGFIPYKAMDLGLDKRDPFFNVTPPRMGPESSHVSGRISREADETASQFAANRGEAPGRMDSDVGVQRLLAQTDLPNETFFKRARRAVLQVSLRVLDVLALTWPKEKWVEVLGPFNIYQGLTIRREEMPNSKDVSLILGPLVPGSRLETMGMLNMLRSSQDITSTEYKRALIANGMQPKGVELEDPDSEFAVSKTLWIYNDGVTPRPWDDHDDFDLEPHDACVKAMRRFINSIEYKLESSPQVRAALLMELRKHTLKLGNELSRMRAASQFAELDRSRFENRLGADEDSLSADNPLMFTEAV